MIYFPAITPSFCDGTGRPHREEVDGTNSTIDIMPGKIKVKILAGRNLPVMDRSSDTTDAYVEIKFGNTTYKTDVCRKTLNPQWNSEWYRFEVDDSELQDEPLQIRLMDHDTYSANDAIGKVYLNLNPLLLPGVPPPVKNMWTLEATMNSSVGSQAGSVMTGWVPVFDTMHGIRGEVNIIVKVELFLDFNKFRQSSCGVQFFYSPNVPHGYHAQVVHGFVEELIVSDDPEYKWIDKIRTPRASNEARQTLFFKLSGEVQRKIGLKALDLGGNAVIGYLQNFDLEGESGIVARGIGTAITLVKIHDFSNVLSEGPTVEELVTYCSKPKKNVDSPDSDDSVPLLYHSPVFSPNTSPTNMHTTHVSHKFPGYGRTTPKHCKAIMRVTDYRNLEQNKDSVRPLPHSPCSLGFNSRKAGGSSFSLSDDVIDESSMRNLLASEDLRCEPGRNRFSRGLRNLKYLQQNVLARRVSQFRTKASDSLDEESDVDSTYSSTWSVYGSDSARSSVLDLRQNIKRKSFSRAKSSNEGMVALLIKSVHAGFPLDSVKEDRETPTPSPVKFLGDSSDALKKCKISEEIPEKPEDPGSKVFTTSDKIDIKSIESSYNNDFSIPMISSSETDTSTDDDEPSESSTNYNILDDSSSLNELVLKELENPVLGIQKEMETMKKSFFPNKSRISKDKNQPIYRKDSLQTDESTSTDITSSDLDSDFFHDKLESSFRIFDHVPQKKVDKLEEEQEPMPFPEPDANLENSKLFKNTEDENTKSKEIKEEEFIENDKQIFEDDLHLKRRLNEALFFFGQTGNDDCPIADETQENILETSLENTSNLPKTIFLQNEDDKTTELTVITQKEGIEIFSLPLSENESTKSTVIIQPELVESSSVSAFDDNEINVLKIDSQEEGTEIFNEPFFQDNKNNALTVFNRDEEIKDISEDILNLDHANSTFFFPDKIEESQALLDRHNAQKDQNILVNLSFSISKFDLISNESPQLQTDPHYFLDNIDADHSRQPEENEIQQNTFNTSVEKSDDQTFDSSQDFDSIQSTRVQELNISGENHYVELASNKLLMPSNASEPKYDNEAEELKIPLVGPQDTLNLSNFILETSENSQPLNLEPAIAESNILIDDNFLKDKSNHEESESKLQQERNVLVPQFSQYEGTLSPQTTEVPESTRTQPLKISPGDRNFLNINNSREVVLKEDKSFTYHPSLSQPEKINIKKEISEDKSSRKVERTDTVIYKGPLDEKGRPITPKVEKRLAASKSSSSELLPIPIFVEHVPEKSNLLKVPIVHTLDVNVKSTYTKKETELAENVVLKEHQLEGLRNSEVMQHKYRRTCMLDLMKLIDTKMMVHTSHHHKKDSFRSTRKRRDKISKNLTPSPDSSQKARSHRRRSKSRSPEMYPHGKFPSTSTLNSVQAPSVHTHHHTVRKHASPSLQAHNHSVENTCKHIHDNSQDSNPVLMKDNLQLAKSVTHPLEREIRKSAIDKLATSLQSNGLNNSSIDVELRELKLNNISSIPIPEIAESPSENFSSVCSLKEPVKELIVSTKNTNAAVTDHLRVSCSPPFPRHQEEASTSPVHATTNSTNVANSLTSKAPHLENSKPNPSIPLHRRSSDSDLSITPKGNSLAGSDRSMGGYLKPTTAIRTMNQEALDMLEYPFITMQQYPPGFVLHIGGLVSARSVKLLERISNPEEPEGRDSWWTEIRMEVRSHARALACNVVIGYREETSISDDVCVLSASGTAAVINLQNTGQDQDTAILNRAQLSMAAASIDSDRDKTQQKINTKNDKNENEVPVMNQIGGKVKRTSESNDHEIPYSLPISSCSLCHLPYSESSVPFKVNVTKCAICRRAKVADVLFTTIELPDNVPITGRGCFIQAIVCKCKKDLRGELNAKEISDCLPFLEYELHSLLVNKLKVKGMNAIFGLKVQVSIGEKLIIGMAVGTAIYLTALPPPSMPQIASGNSWHNEEQLNEIQKNLVETVKKNREFYKLKNTDLDNGRSRSDTDESDDDLPEMDLSMGAKDACVLEVDDLEDMERVALLMDDTPPDDFHVVNTQTIPGLEDLEIVRNLQMFTQVSRAKIPSGQFSSMPSKYFARLLQTVYFKLRRMVPCALCDLRFRVALPEQDEIQLSVVGMALGLGEPSKYSKHRRKLMSYSSSKDQLKKSDDCDMIFTLDEDIAESVASNTTETTTSVSNNLLYSQKPRSRSPLRIKSQTMHRDKHVPLKERYGVDLTPLSYLPGGRIERYLGNLNFFFIRESTSIRENGGISGFTHSFVNEVLSIVRAHVTALGGNAMVAFFMTQCVLLHSPHKNHGQCLINVGGDVVSFSYFGDERQTGNTIC
ncbi:uncharacterized protein LOC117170664 [Belonocnema kinseyi]|uniref:uncharacterized protein LOC117170664 n=1 Tax=Belonocnema kinseyi TaxID=2817044 RepID=UPI00143E0477|nr:uncharacterized protein LOC117170664 [Belonocnema kinseyi]